MKFIKRALFVLLSLVLIVTLAAGGAFFYFTRQSFPQTSGTIKVAGLKGIVEIIRDNFGVPHIYADSPDDLFFAQGFVHAQERFFQMEFWRRIGQGRLSELFGKGALNQDKFIRTLGWHHTAEEEVKNLSPEIKAILESYAAGVNAYILNNASTLSFEFNLLNLQGRNWKPEPWTPANTLTWGKAMSWNLGDNFDSEIIRAAVIEKGGSELAEAVIPPYPKDMPVIVPSKSDVNHQPSIAIRQSSNANSDWVSLVKINRSFSERLGIPRGGDIGSNNWVIAGSKTTTGKPILADDPHLGIQMPSIWFQNGLHCRAVSSACPFDVVGVIFPSVPGVVIGHNSHIAWGVTNGTVDTQDLFIEKQNPNNPDEFEFKGTYEKATIREERINVAGNEAVNLRVRVTRHGPIMNDVEPSLKSKPPMALSWAALQPGTLIQSVIEIDKAQNWEQFREALKKWSAPSQNFVYADVDGNIGYQFNGDIPIRAKGDGSVPVEGWTGENEWTGFIPFDQLPSKLNPPEGFIVTANNAIVDDKYPFVLSKRDWDFGFRAKRITHMISQLDKIGVEDVHKMQFDSRAIFADELLPMVFDAVQPSKSNPQTQTALDALRKWDKYYSRNSIGATIFETFKLKLAHAVFDDDLGDDLKEEALSVGTVTWTALRNLKPDSRWWDDARTSEKETREQIVSRTFDEALTDLSKRLGNDVGKWQWGALHQATFKNQTLGQSGISLVENIFNRGPFPADGGTGLVNAVGHRPDFSVRSVPSLRMVVDFNNFDNSTLIHTTGQSGHAYHPHYDDMIDKWLNGQTNVMWWSAEKVKANAKTTLSMTP
jgi:penicillin amidase